MWLNSRIGAFGRLGPKVKTLLLILMGLVASLGQAPFGAVFLSLIGFASVFLVFSFAETDRAAAKMGWAFGLGYFVLTMQWLVSPFLVEADRHGWMAPFAVVLLAGGLALLWGAAFAAARRFDPAALIVTLPLAELARAYVFTGFPWGMPAYGAVDTIFAQGAAWVGSHGLNVVLLALAYVLAWTVTGRGFAGWSWRLGFAAIAVTLIVPLKPMQATDDAAVIRLIQPNAPQHQKWESAFMPIFFDRALAFTAAEGQPDLILWPETSLPYSLPGGIDAVDEIAAAANGVPFVVGANRFDDLLLMNAAVLVDEAGQISQIYDKAHLVPFGEYMPFGEVLARFGIHGLAASEGRGFTPGAGAELMDLGGLGQALPLICYEAVFPQDVGAYLERPDFLMQITNDAWFGTFSGPYQHLVQAQMRAIEQGLPFVRAANTGVSAMIDARGRVVDSLPLNEAGFLDVALPPALPMTLYAKTGDWTVFLLLLAGYIGLWVRKRRESN